MAKRLQVRLVSGWRLVNSPRQDYAYRLLRETSKHYGVLDVTFAEYKSGEIPNPSCTDLIELAQGDHKNVPRGLASTECGECDFGKFGMARLSSDQFQYIERWFLSNGRDFIIAEYHNHIIPEAIEVKELREIVKRLNLADGSAVQSK